ncbi:MAG: hypothetical protein ACYC6N_05505 [Pirellulaceae bacterium]
MSNPGYTLSIYLHLAAASHRRRRPHVRDRFLLLAGVVATEMDLDPLAAHCRKLVLHHNPRHLVGRWQSLREALSDADFLCFLKQLRRRYPHEKAEQLLQSLDIDAESERRAYYSDYEYAAALLGTTPAALDQAAQEL